MKWSTKECQDDLKFICEMISGKPLRLETFENLMSL